MIERELEPNDPSPQWFAISSAAMKYFPLTGSLIALFPQNDQDEERLPRPSPAVAGSRFSSEQFAPVHAAEHLETRTNRALVMFNGRVEWISARGPGACMSQSSAAPARASNAAAIELAVERASTGPTAVWSRRFGPPHHQNQQQERQRHPCVASTASPARAKSESRSRRTRPGTSSGCPRALAEQASLRQNSRGRVPSQPFHLSIRYPCPCP